MLTVKPQVSIFQLVTSSSTLNSLHHALKLIQIVYLRMPQLQTPIIGCNISRQVGSINKLALDLLTSIFQQNLQPCIFNSLHSTFKTGLMNPTKYKTPQDPLFSFLADLFKAIDPQKAEWIKKKMRNARLLIILHKISDYDDSWVMQKIEFLLHRLKSSILTSYHAHKYVDDIVHL